MQPSALMCGRYQPFHAGHDWLIRQELQHGPVQIAVRNIEPDDRNPLTTQQTVEILEAAYEGEAVRVIVIDDIRSVSYGRGVGYDITEHVPPPDIGGISATRIRECIANGDDSWKDVVPAKAQALVAEYLG